MQKKIQQLQSQLNKELEIFFEQKGKEASSLSDINKQIVDNLKEFTMRGGKRLRPILMIQTYKMFGGKKEEKVVQMAICLELLQSFLLIHDDIIDRDEMRRGGKTFHTLFKENAQKKRYENPQYFGISMGILGGDISNQWVFEVIAQANFSEKIKNQILNIIAQSMVTAAIGEVDDVNLEYIQECNEQDILNVMKNKTASYTFEIPMVVGAMLAGVDKQNIDKLKAIAESVGIAFQIQDDILGTFGDSSKTGKANFADLQEGKKTLLVLKAMENGDEKQRNILSKLIGKDDLNEKEVLQIRKIIKDTGSYQYSQQLAQKYIEKAKNELNSVDVEQNEGWEFLNRVMDYVVNREK